MNKDFDYYREKYIQAINNGLVPIEGAYYYFLLHGDNYNDLNVLEFQEIFNKALNNSINVISMEIEEACLDMAEIIEILNNYYCVQLLYNKNNELILIN